MILLSIVLGISVLFNVLLLWYIRKMLQKLLFVSDNIADLQGAVNEFSNHIGGIHEMETFYGDETLGGLIRHSKQLVENIKEFEDIYSLTYDEQEEVEGDGGFDTEKEEE